MPSCLLSIFSALFAGLLFLQRPAAFGQNYTVIGLFALVGVTLVYIALNGARLVTDHAHKQDFLFLATLVVLYLAYESIIALAFGASNLDFWGKEMVTTLAVVGGYTMYLVNPQNNRLFFWRFTTVISLLGWSSTITLVAAAAVGLDHLKLFHFTMQNYENFGGSLETGTVYFPLSMAYSSLLQSDVFSLYRFSGFFREAGIYQAVAGYCLVLASLENRSKFLRLGLVCGILCTFSTIGVATLVAVIVMVNVIQRRLTVMRVGATIIILLAGAYATFYAPLIGYEYKRDTQGFSISVDEREGALTRGMNRVLDNPLGDGPYSGRHANDSITLVASMRGIGIFGFILQVIMLLGVRGRFDKTTLYRMGACMPLLLTSVMSQPIAGTPLIYVLLMVRPRCSPGSSDSPRGYGIVGYRVEATKP